MISIPPDFLNLFDIFSGPASGEPGQKSPQGHKVSISKVNSVIFTLRQTHRVKSYFQEIMIMHAYRVLLVLPPTAQHPVPVAAVVLHQVDVQVGGGVEHGQQVGH